MEKREYFISLKKGKVKKKLGRTGGRRGPSAVPSTYFLMRPPEPDDEEPLDELPPELEDEREEDPLLRDGALVEREGALELREGEL